MYVKNNDGVRGCKKKKVMHGIAHFEVLAFHKSTDFDYYSAKPLRPTRETCYEEHDREKIIVQGLLVLSASPFRGRHSGFPSTFVRIFCILLRHFYYFQVLFHRIQKPQLRPSSTGRSIVTGRWFIRLGFRDSFGVFSPLKIARPN